MLQLIASLARVAAGDHVPISWPRKDARYASNCRNFI